ncbi:MAG TPA: hypothetical protein VFO58_03215 [Vicinamibacterales bacterium]|nr:hypothetical protein [Vicinamibacterales bacterium]
MFDDKQADKGPKQADKGPKQADKGPKQADKGPKQADKGQPSEVAEDVFRQVTGLGGFLLVAFVAPMAPNTSAVRNGPTPRDSALALLGNKALERDNEATEQRRQDEERDRELVTKLATSIRTQSQRSSRQSKKKRANSIPSGKQRQQNWSLKSVKD